MASGSTPFSRPPLSLRLFLSMVNALWVAGWGSRGWGGGQGRGGFVVRCPRPFDNVTMPSVTEAHAPLGPPVPQRLRAEGVNGRGGAFLSICVFLCLLFRPPSYVWCQERVNNKKKRLRKERERGKGGGSKGRRERWRDRGEKEKKGKGRKKQPPSPCPTPPPLASEACGPS